MLYHKPLIFMKPNGGASGASRQKGGGNILQYSTQNIEQIRRENYEQLTASKNVVERVMQNNGVKEGMTEKDIKEAFMQKINNSENGGVQIYPGFIITKNTFFNGELAQGSITSGRFSSERMTEILKDINNIKIDSRITGQAAMQQEIESRVRDVLSKYSDRDLWKTYVEVQGIDTRPLRVRMAEAERTGVTVDARSAVFSAKRGEALREQWTHAATRSLNERFLARDSNGQYFWQRSQLSEQSKIVDHAARSAYADTRMKKEIDKLIIPRQREHEARVASMNTSSNNAAATIVQGIKAGARAGNGEMRLPRGDYRAIQTAADGDKVYREILQQYPKPRDITARKRGEAYTLYQTRSDGEKIKIGQIMPALSQGIGGTRSEEYQQAYIRQSMYAATGRVRNSDGTILRPWGYWGNRENYERAVRTGVDIPSGIREYYEANS